MRIFIADDSQVIIERLIELVGEIPGVHVIGVAKRAEKATVRIQELKPDLVILDIKMPDGNGIDVLKSISQMHPKPVVIMFTNYALPQYREKCLTLGAEYFFDKSEEFEKIPGVLKSLTNSKSGKFKTNISNTEVA